MTRSENMAKVKSKDTKPEIYIRKLLYSVGVRYRLHRKNLPGSPDLSWEKNKTALFINGCFWHMHKGCSLATIPKIRTDFWREKLTGNMFRDKEHYCRLQNMGYQVLIVWGCTIKRMQRSKAEESRVLEELLAALQHPEVGVKEW